MTQVQIGWFGTGTLQTQAATIDDTPTGIRVTGRLSATDPVQLVALRTQFVGLGTQPGRPVPVLIDTAPHLTGWYTVEDVTVGLAPGDLTVGWWPYSIDLARTGRILDPVHEARLVGALRTNSQSRTVCAGWWAVPADTTLEAGPASMDAPTVRETAEGPLRVYTAGTAGLLDSTLGYRTPVAAGMVGAARIGTGDIASAPSTAFAAVGREQTYTVPAGVARLRVDVRGAAGGGVGGGRGARVSCEVEVTAGEVLTVRVGRRGPLGAGGWNGGGAGGRGGYSAAYGGGGCTQLSRTGTDLVVAGGGGGQGAWQAPATYRPGGAGGANGANAGSGSGGFPGGFGRGGTTAAGGAGGVDGAGRDVEPGQDGTAGQGGAGGAGMVTIGLGGGGGGGGVFGGGGGAAFHTYINPGNARYSGSGGGGSSMGSGEAEQVVAGFQAGDGEAIVTPILPDSASMIERTTVTGYDAGTAYGWCLDNGIIRVTPAYRADAFMLDVQCWDGTEWGPLRRWQLVDSDTMSLPAAMSPTGITILENTAERVAIRVTLQAGSKATAAAVTLTLRRGSPLVETRLVAVAADWGWAVETASNGTSLTGGGLIATTADSSGSKWLAASTTGAKVTTGNSGWSSSSSVAALTVALGFLPAGFTETADTLLAQWFAAASATVRAVSS